MALTGFLIALPAAVIALLFVFWRAPVFLGIALVTFPKLYRYQHTCWPKLIPNHSCLRPNSRGQREPNLFRHVIPLVWAPCWRLPACPQAWHSVRPFRWKPFPILLEWSLAWQAALNRDLPLLTSITLCVTLLTVAVISLPTLIGQRKSS